VDRWAIVDTGPLVSFLDVRDQDHDWTVQAFRTLRGPLITCEPVITEALFLLRTMPVAQDKILEWVDRKSLLLPFSLAAEVDVTKALLKKYRDLPMSLADACILRMAELFDKYSVFTLDSDFAIYRKHGRTPLSLICPRA
jgi:predicted nucleic acid-binding protein